jgi:Tol biopolymer transport system component
MGHTTTRHLAVLATLLIGQAMIPPTAAATLPFGTHDGPDGTQSQYTCSAWGWAVDQDDRNAVVTVRVLVDGVELRRGPAGDFRQDLLDTGTSPTGKAAFVFGLWNDVTKDAWHTILVQALDVGTTDTWTPINLTPRRISCHEYAWYDYELFVKDLPTGETRQLTRTTGRGDYNPAWSPDGTRVAHDLALPDSSGAHGARGSIGITTVADGRTKTVKGTYGGNDARWSRDGKSLLFDRVTAGDRSIYSIPASGGTRRLIRRDAASADLSPTGRRIVFLEPSSSRIVTVDAKGLHPMVVARLRTKVNPDAGFFDVSPVWSPDGRWIAYADGGHIWKVRVASSGAPLARPVRLTAGKATADDPSWSADGKSVYFQARYGDEFQIWRIGASGGIPTKVTEGPGLNGFGDYNAVESPAGNAVVYSSVKAVTPPS